MVATLAGISEKSSLMGPAAGCADASLLTLAVDIEDVPFSVYAPHDSPFATMITCTFAHDGVVHLIGNLLLLYIVGFNVESRLGPVRFIAFYLMAAVVSSTIHGIWDLRPLLGASGPISAVMGAYLVLYTHARLRLLIFPILLLLLLCFFIWPPVYTLSPIWQVIILLIVVPGLLFFQVVTVRAWVLLI